MKQIIIGEYTLALLQVQVVLREETGGEFYTSPVNGACPRIKIGAEYELWPDVVGVLTHEVMELFFAIRGGRYAPSNGLVNGSDRYLFVCDHNLFSEACGATGKFLAQCLPDVSRAWEKWPTRKGAK